MTRRFSPTLLRQLRHAAGLKRERLAANADCSASSINKYENATSRPSAATLGRLADALNCSTDDFFEKEAAA